MFITYKMENKKTESKKDHILMTHRLDPKEF